jgi:hypothetical protein
VSIPEVGGLRMERISVRMLHKVCPAKEAHDKITEKDEFCRHCGISRTDYQRFVLGDEGKEK